MYFDLDEDQRSLRDLVRRLLADECPPSVVRAAWPGGEDSLLEPVWRKLAGIGVPGLLVDETLGGTGLDETYMVALLEQTGHAGLPLPTVATVAVAAPLLAASPDRAELLADVLSGQTLIGCQLEASSTDGTVLVPHGQLVSAAIVITPRGLGLVSMAAARPVASTDGARRLARVDVRAAVPLHVDDEALDLAVARATVGTAAELIGLSRRMLAITVEYVCQRTQFGVPVGGFQAIKHQLADALLAIEFAGPAVRRAGYSLATGDANAEREVSAAKALASEAATSVARTTIQCHGAIAYTTEYDHHLFAKRAWALAQEYGNAAAHRQRLAGLLGLRTDHPSRTIQKVAP